MTIQLQEQIEKLYQEDFVLWVDETVKQLRAKDLNNLDWDHLIEEIEGLGSEQRHKVDSYLAQLLIHLLLDQYWEIEKELCKNRWESEIGNFRLQLEILFDSKTLYNYFLERIEAIYPRAKKRVIKRQKLPPETFPLDCPFTAEQILDVEFLHQ